MYNREKLELLAIKSMVAMSQVGWEETRLFLFARMPEEASKGTIAKIDEARNNNPMGFIRRLNKIIK